MWSKMATVEKLVIFLKKSSDGPPDRYQLNMVEMINN